MKKRLIPLVLLAILVVPRAAHAIADCTVSATAVSFGVYDPLSPAPLTANGSVTVSCSLLGIISLLVAYDIHLSTGNSGNYTARALKTASNDVMNYNLFTNSSYSSIWGNSTGGSVHVTDGYLLGLGPVSLSYPVYGRIPATQNVRGGSYTDSIIVTIYY